MKILIAYDGSGCSDAALDDLRKAGIPNSADALILSVAETWLPPQFAKQNVREYANVLQNQPAKYSGYAKGGKLIAEAETFANHAKKRVLENFPDWKVTAETSYGSPAWEIVDRASSFNADLIVIGSHGHTALGRVWLGSISNKVLTDADQTVRVARGSVEVDPSPIRIIIGYDGSDGSKAAINAILARSWPGSTEIRLITATNHVLPTSIGRFVPPIAEWIDDEFLEERDRIEKLGALEINRLSSIGTNIDHHMCPGNPKQVLVEEARKWDADCVFVGATTYSRAIEKYVLGSTAAAVAERCHCSVEVVRA